MKTRSAAVIGATLLAITMSGASASASTYVSGGSYTCSGSTRFVAVTSRANGTTDVYTSGVKRITYYNGSTVTTRYYESTSHYISSWKVQTTDSINASQTYPYCYYS